MSGISDKILWLFSKREAWTNVDAARELGLPLSSIDHAIQVMHANGWFALLVVDHPSGLCHLDLSEKGRNALNALRVSFQAGKLPDQ